MKVSQNKHSSWIYIMLILMLLALVGFSMLPLINSFLEDNRAVKTASAPASEILQNNQAQLETEAKGYELVLQRESDNNTALRGLLEIRLKQGDIKAATIPLEKLATLNPQQTEYMVLLAQAKQQLNDYEGAALAYRSVLATHPNDMNALQGLVNLLLQQNRPEGAIGLLQDTLKGANQGNTEPTNTIDITSVQLLLGQVYVNQQRYTEAITVYDQAAQTNPEDFRPILAKGLVLKEQGKIEEAKPLFAQAVSLAPAKYKDQIQQMTTQLETSTPPNSTPETPTLESQKEPLKKTE